MVPYLGQSAAALDPVEVAAQGGIGMTEAVYFGLEVFHPTLGPFGTTLKLVVMLRRQLGCVSDPLEASKVKGLKTRFKAPSGGPESPTVVFVGIAHVTSLGYGFGQMLTSLQTQAGR